MAETTAATIARIAASGDSLPQRAESVLVTLQRAVGCDAAWLASVDRFRGRYDQLASINVAAPVAELLDHPAVAHHLPDSAPGHARWSPALQPRLSEEERSDWSASLTADGIHHTLSVALVASGSRHVGHVALFFKDPSPPSRTTRRRLLLLAPLLALAVDPLPTLLATARLVRGAAAGRVLRRDGRTESMPGLDDDQLLATGSPILLSAFQSLHDGLVHSSFLWPIGGWHAPDEHVRITVLAAPEDVPPIIVGMALTSPPPDLHELTPRELEVLGLMVEGCSNQEMARILVVSPRTVAAHVEHVLVKLDVTTRTLAAVRAERGGLFVPPLLLHALEAPLGDPGGA